MKRKLRFHPSAFGEDPIFAPVSIPTSSSASSTHHASSASSSTHHASSATSSTHHASFATSSTKHTSASYPCDSTLAPDPSFPSSSYSCPTTSTSSAYATSHSVTGFPDTPSSVFGSSFTPHHPFSDTKPLKIDQKAPRPRKRDSDSSYDVDQADGFTEGKFFSLKL